MLEATVANFWYGLAFLLMTVVMNLFVLVMCYRWNAYFLRSLARFEALAREIHDAQLDPANRGPRSFATRL